MVTIENYEEYLMLAADGELDAAGKEALDAFLERHPELASEAAAWQALHMQPDEQIVFAEKETLLRREPRRIVLGWKAYALGAAASLLFAVVLISRQAHRDVPQVAHNLPAHPPARNAKLALAVPLPEKTFSHTVRQRNTAIRQRAMKEESQASVRADEALPALTGSPVVELATRPLQASVSAKAVLTASVQPVLKAFPEAATEEQQPLIRLAAANVPAVEMLKEGVDARVMQISNAVKTIRETAIAVRIGNKDHYLNF